MNGKQRLTISLEGLYYAVVMAFIIGGAALRGINLLYVLAGMMIGPLIYNWRMVTVMLRRVGLRRVLPEGVCAGDLLVVEFVATGKSRRGGASAIVVSDLIRRDACEDLDEQRRATVFFSHVAAGKTEVQSYQGRLMRRGKYSFGPFRVSSRFPLGLMQRTITTSNVEPFIVFPRPGRLLPRWKQASQSIMAGASGGRSRQGLVEGDFYGLRDWRSGDSRRWIHWRTSARRNALAVRQFELPKSQDTSIILDLWQPNHATDEHRDNVELAISFAATVAEDVCRQGHSRVGIGIAGLQPWWKQSIGSRPLLTEIMEQLALAEPTSHDTLPELLSACLHEVSAGAKTVLVSTRFIDLQDTKRFKQIWDEPGLRHLLRGILCIDVSGSELFEYFEAG